MELPYGITCGLMPHILKLSENLSVGIISNRVKVPKIFFKLFSNGMKFFAIDGTAVLFPNFDMQ